MLTKQRELNFLREHFLVNLAAKQRVIPCLLCPVFLSAAWNVDIMAGAQAASWNRETAWIEQQDRRSLDSSKSATVWTAFLQSSFHD